MRVRVCILLSTSWTVVHMQIISCSAHYTALCQFAFSAEFVCKSVCLKLGLNLLHAYTVC